MSHGSCLDKEGSVGVKVVRGRGSMAWDTNGQAGLAALPPLALLSRDEHLPAPALGRGEQERAW